VGSEKAGWGLWEIAARYSYVDLTDGFIRGGIMGDLGLALNWYPRMHVRVMFNYILAMRNGIGRSNIVGARLALDF
jgi:phosphate-selective porin OprO/OprP